MSEWETVRHRVTLAGRVTDPETGDPVEDALVRLVEAPAPVRARADTARALGLEAPASGRLSPDRTRSAADGSFFFLDLPPGAYAVEAESGGGASGRRTSEKVRVRLDGGEETEASFPRLELTLTEPE